MAPPRGKFRTVAGDLRRAVHRAYAERWSVAGIAPGALTTLVAVDDAWLEAPHPRDPRWTIAYRLGLQDGALAVSELRVLPTESLEGRREPGQWAADVLGTAAPFPRGGVTARLLRAIQLGADRRHAIARMRHLAEHDAAFFPFPKSDALSALMATRRRTRRAKLEDLAVARVAQAYASAAKTTHRPNVEIAKKFGVSPTRVRDLVREARIRSLLTPASSTQVGGALTDKAITLLRRRRR
jgi:hypothetical protein